MLFYIRGLVALYFFRHVRSFRWMFMRQYASEWGVCSLAVRWWAADIHRSSSSSVAAVAVIRVSRYGVRHDKSNWRRCHAIYDGIKGPLTVAKHIFNILMMFRHNTRALPLFPLCSVFNWRRKRRRWWWWCIGNRCCTDRPFLFSLSLCRTLQFFISIFFFSLSLIWNQGYSGNRMTYFSRVIILRWRKDNGKFVKRLANTWRRDGRLTVYGMEMNGVLKIGKKLLWAMNELSRLKVGVRGGFFFSLLTCLASDKKYAFQHHGKGSYCVLWRRVLILIVTI